MDTPINTGSVGYADSFGQRIDQKNIRKWFSHGVKSVGTDKQNSLFSPTTTLFAVVSIGCFIILCIVIIVPIIIGSISPKRT